MTNEELIERAVEVLAESLPGDQQFYWNDAFFPMEEIDSVFDDEPPEFVFVCDKVFFQIDIEHAIENVAANDHYSEDFDITDELVDRDELESFIDKWNGKQRAHTWHPDFSRKFRVPK